MQYCPLKIKTHYSLQESLIKPDNLVEHLVKHNITSCAITDSGSISGAVDFSSLLHKKNIKPILGTDVLVKSWNGWLTLIAKNQNGWRNLVTLTSESNQKSNLIDRYGRDFPTISLSDISKYKDLICMVGQPFSFIANMVFNNFNAYLCFDGGIDAYVKRDAVDIVVNQLELLKTIFGRENVFVNISTHNNHLFPASKIIAEVMREAAKKADIKAVACFGSNYLENSEHDNHKLVLASLLKTTHNLFDIHKYPELSEYYHSFNSLPKPEEVANFGNTEEEIKNSLLVSDMCESYTLTSKIRAPKFDCPDGLTEMQYLHKLAQEGYLKRFNPAWDKQLYGDRVKQELATIEKAGLAGYFLIVQDYINFCKKQDWLVGPGRGSVGGSLVSYLIGITMVDPIPFGLLFERFYNDGRNTADRIAFPDIDVDFPITKREQVIQYIRDKYGHDKVGQMVTFGRMQGRGALKEVLRVHDACDMKTMNEMTEKIPQEHEINDKLEEEGEDSILRWMLENEPEAVNEYCVKNSDGELVGDYAPYFKQAISLEGLYRSQGKHAAGIVISPEPLHELCPMIADKSSDDPIVGYDMHGVEAIGILKMDILGLAILDKLMAANQLLGGN